MELMILTVRKPQKCPFTCFKDSAVKSNNTETMSTFMGDDLLLIFFFVLLSTLMFELVSHAAFYLCAAPCC